MGVDRQTALGLATEILFSLEVDDLTGMSVAEALERAGKAKLADELEASLAHALGVVRRSVDALSVPR